MFDLDRWQEIMNTIQKHKLRTFLTALGVFWGIFMLVFLMGAGKGLENGVMGLFGSHAKNSVYMGGSFTTKPYMGLQPGRNIQLKNSDIAAIKAQFGDKIAYLAPRLWMPSGEVIRGDKKGAFDVRGDMPDLVHIDALTVAEGRFLNDLDIENKRKIAIVGKRVVEVLFEKGEQVIGEYIKVQNVEYRIAGIMHSNRRGNDAIDDEKTIFLPLTTVQQMTNRPDRIGWFVCSMKPNFGAAEVEHGVKALLKKRHKVAPDDRQGIWSDNVEEEFGEIMGLFAGIRFLVWFVGIGSLLAGIIGVGNIMLITVKERTKEIGVRKALGATPSSIISMILMESVFLTTIAGYLGLVCGTLIVYLLNLGVGEGAEFYANPEVDFRIGVIALLILIISGAITGLIPAMQAASINPVIALKDE
ncbi:MAG: ABC transporter permease [Bacteroidota bacterium]